MQSKMKISKPAEPTSIFLSTQDLAAFFAVEPRQVDRWLKDGLTIAHKKSGKNFFDLKTVFDWKMSRALNGGMTELDLEKLRNEKLRGDKLQMQVDEQQKKLIPYELYQIAVYRAMVNCKTAFMALPTDVKLQFSNTTPELMDFLKKRIRAILTELSDTDPGREAELVSKIYNKYIDHAE